jgi:acylphosphatase
VQQTSHRPGVDLPSRTEGAPGPKARPDQRRVQVFYSGHVQGVGFRYTVKSVSAGFEIMGAVRNLTDGRVELTAEGAKAELAAFLEAIREAGLAGFIRHEETFWSEAQGGLRGFEIVRQP